MNDEDKFFMKKAMVRAQTAARHMEVPVGAVIVKDGVVIASGRNEREAKKDSLAHAEITAIRRACKKLGRWRLHDCDLYVTLEPCPMCAGAIINSRIRRVVFGAYDGKAGAFGSTVDLNSYPFNHSPEIVGGVLEKECADMLSDFFKDLRENRKRQKGENISG